MKKSIALILSIILLVTIGMPVCADGIDPSDVPSGNHIYLDSGEWNYISDISTNQPGADFGNLDDLFTFHSSKEIKTLDITEDINDAFWYEKGWVVEEDESKGEWRTTIQFSKTSPKGGFNLETPGTVYTANGKFTFVDETEYKFKLQLTIEGYPVALFKDRDVLQLGENTVTIQLHGVSSTEGLSAEWIVEENSSVLHAGFSEKESDRKTTIISQDFKMMDECPSNTIILYGYHPGEITLNCKVSGPDGFISNDRRVGLAIEGFEAMDDTDLADAKSDLQQGNSTTIEIKQDTGLSPAQLQDLKNAANGANSQITLKPENDEGLELEMSFPVSKIDTTKTDKVFTPSFTPKIPPEAEENGFSDAAETVTWIRFDYDGVPPAPMTIRMRAPAGISDGTLVKIWRYNEQIQKLEVQTTVECENGFITFTLNHFSTYAVYPASVDPNPSSDYTPSIKPSQSSGGSGGGGGSSSHSSSAVSKGILNGSALSVKTTAAAKSVSIADATNAANKAIAQAKADGKSTASVQFVNAASLSKATLDAVQKAGNQKGIKVAVCADTVMNGTVAARLYIDPTAATLDNEIGTEVQLDNPVIDQHFKKYFKNNLKAIKFMHQGSFGMELGVAIKLDLQKIDASKIVLYSYDVASNSYQKLPNQTFFIDKNGYLHFYVTSGGYVVISEGIL